MGTTGIRIAERVKFNLCFVQLLVLSDNYRLDLVDLQYLPTNNINPFMKRTCSIILFLALAFTATAQKVYPNEAHIIGLLIPDAGKDFYFGGAYYYNFSDRSAIGARVAYHAGKKSEFYQSQSRYFELSYRWRFQRPENKISWSLSTGPWVQIFTSQNSGIFRGDDRWNVIGMVSTAGLHYHFIPRVSVGIAGLVILEIFPWQQGEDPAFYPLLTPAIGLQLAYAW